MDSSPVSIPAPMRGSQPMRHAGLVLLWLGLSILPGSASSNTTVVKTCSPASARTAYEPRGFGGYACRDDRCSSHKAGFDWAQRNGIADASACASPRDPAFVEGCRAFAEEAVTAEQAGFEWARENEIEDTCDCAGAGPGFDAGCVAYVTGMAQ
jgi:hypothetical protein